jgi:hypothetical protein
MRLGKPLQAKGYPHSIRLFRLIRHDERSVARPRFAGSLPHVAFLRSRVILEFVDELFLIFDLFEQRCVLLFKLANGLSFVIEGVNALGTAEHNGSIGGQADEPAENYNRT